MDAPTGPLWSQKQAIAYEVALEAINDVIAGYSEQIALEQTHPAPNTARITWLEMRTDQAVSVHHSLNGPVGPKLRFWPSRRTFWERGIRY